MLNKRPSARTARFKNRELKSARLLDINHPALTDCRTIYPSTIVDEALPLRSGHSNPKVGNKVEKGGWAGMPIFTLTLEERATCPRSCRHWRSCYGNNMHLAKRNAHGPNLEQRLRQQLALLQKANPAGFVVRLHVLGDFYSVEYVKFWSSMMSEFPAIRAFGYTAHAGDEIAEELKRVRQDYWGRWFIRTSNGPIMSFSTVSIEHKFQKPDDAIICPAQSHATESCSTCGLCWQTGHRIAFLQH